MRQKLRAICPGCGRLTARQIGSGDFNRHNDPKTGLECQFPIRQGAARL